MAYSKYKMVISIGRSDTTKPFKVQIKTFETVDKDKPFTRQYNVSEKRLQSTLAILRQQGFTIDARYAIYGQWYAVKYFGESTNEK